MLNALKPMMKRITINPLTDHRWARLISTQPSSIFHSPAWIRILVNTYGFDIKANILVSSEDDGSADVPIGGLLYCTLADIRGQRISSLPFCDFLDPLAETFEQWQMLVEPLLDTQLLFKVRPLHSTLPLADNRFEKVNQARWHGLDLSGSIDELWNSFHGSVRTSVRKAEKNNVTLRIADSDDDLNAFFQLHVGVRKNKYRMVAQPYQFFENIWRELISAEHGRLYLAMHNDEVVAATIFLHWQDTLYYKFNASNPKMLWLNPNEPLLWEGIKYGKEIGCHHFDFGLSDWEQDGLNFYKRKFASNEKTIHFLQSSTAAPQLKQGELENGNDVGVLLPKLTALFTDDTVPQDIAQKAGELLYRYFA